MLIKFVSKTSTKVQRKFYICKRKMHFFVKMFHFSRLMQRNVMFMLPSFVLKHQFVFGLVRAERVHKTLPDMVNRHRRRMHQIIGIKAIVPEFI